MPLPIKKVGVYPMQWMLSDCMRYLTETIWRLSHTEPSKRWHPCMNVHAMYQESFTRYPKSPETYAIVYVSYVYNSHDIYWFEPWSAYVDRRSLAEEALSGNEYALAIVALFAFEWAPKAFYGYERFDLFEKSIYGNK